MNATRRPPVPPFTRDTAAQKVRMAENASPLGGFQFFGQVDIERRGRMMVSPVDIERRGRMMVSPVDIERRGRMMVSPVDIERRGRMMVSPVDIDGNTVFQQSLSPRR